MGATTMTTRTKIILISVSLLSAFAVGRYTVPEKIRVETKTVEVEKKVDDTKTQTDRDKHKKTTVVETVKPDGEKTTTTVTEEDTTTKRSTDDKSAMTDNKATDQVTEKTYGTQKTTLSALGAINLTGTPSIAYGASVYKPVLGPFGIGAMFLTNGTVGLSVGISF
jgi:hypothetical protein